MAEALPEKVSSSENDRDTSTLIFGNSLRVHIPRHALAIKFEFTADANQSNQSVTVPTVDADQSNNSATSGHALSTGLAQYIRSIKLHLCHSGLV